jgi:cytochrome c553
MKNLGLTIASLAISLWAAGPLHAQPDAPYPLALLPLPPASGPPVKDCTYCHGVSAQGLAVAPRLAGQRAGYIVKEINAFHEHLRDNPYSKLYMWNAAANLKPDTARALADYFSHEAPRPADDGNRALVDQGRALYQQGDAEANIVTCVACHGPNAEGVGAIPRLGGLSYAYLKRRMAQWNEGYHPAAKPMPQVTRNLSAEQIDALASYLSFLDGQAASR